MLETEPAVILRRALDRHFPDAHCELLFSDAWELLIAVILSGQTAAARVNQVLAVLNEHFIGPEAYAELHPLALEGLIRRLPAYRLKARAIVEAARMICDRHQGQVPATRAELERLPGMGRSAVAVVLGNAFAEPAVAIDAHVQRVLGRLGWAPATDARAAEQAVMERLPAAAWVRVSHQLQALGRSVCRPRWPRCHNCPIGSICPGAVQEPRLR